MKAKPKKSTTIKDLTLKDMRRFHMSVDWADWWEHFYLDVGPSGAHKWKNTRSFAKGHAVNDKQYQFILYATGSPKEGEGAPEEFKFVEPMSWLEKRRTGGWYAPKSFELISKQISTKMDALEALRESGATVTINSLVRMERMAEQVDREFGGTFLDEALSFPQNRERARLYVELHERILRMHAISQDLYAKSHGINLQNDSLAQIVTGATMAFQAGLTARGIGTSQRGRAEKIIGKVIDMTFEKATTHAIALPEEMTKKVAEVAESIKVQ